MWIKKVNFWHNFQHGICEMHCEHLWFSQSAATSGRLKKNEKTNADIIYTPRIFCSIFEIFQHPNEKNDFFLLVGLQSTVLLS